MLRIEIKTPNLNGLKQQFRQVSRRLPRLLGATAVEYVHDNFRAQGYIDRGVEKWKSRKVDDRNPRQRAILVKTGALRRDIRIRSTGKDYVIVGTSLPYASIHNEGGTIDHPGGTAYFFKDGKIFWIKNSTAARMKRRMPRTKRHPIHIERRQFMPTNERPSAKLNTMLQEVIVSEINKIK